MLFGHRSWCWSWSVILFFMYWTWSSVLWRLELELKVTKVVESKKPIYVMFFVWTLYLMLTATSDIRCSSMSSTVFWRVTPESPKVACLLEPATFRPCTWFQYIHFHVKENSNAISYLETWPLAWGHARIIDFKVHKNAWRYQHGMCNWPQTLTGYAGSQTHDG